MRPFFRIVSVLLIFSAACPLAAQEKKPPPAEKPKTRLEKLRQSRELSQINPVRSVLEGPIDPETYPLGPGDELFISIWGTVLEDEIPLVVLPEGVVNIPGSGAVSVKNMTLKQAERFLADRLSGLYQANRITVALVNIRTFKVYVTGEVELPAEYNANITTRASSLIEQALGLTQWADGRAIEIRRRDGTTQRFDYVEYLLKGDQKNNPTVIDGDVIFVPAANFSQGVILLRSGNETVRYYQYYKDESIYEFMKRANLGSLPLDWANAAIARRSAAGGTETIKLAGAPLRNGEFLAVTLEPGDIITVPTLRQYVFVGGEVKNPGGIPWEPDRTASYYVGTAGKTSAAVSGNKMTVISENEKKDYSGTDPVIYPGDIITVPKRRLLQLTDYLNFIAPVTSLVIAAKAVGWIK